MIFVNENLEFVLLVFLDEVCILGLIGLLYIYSLVKLLMIK